MTHAKSLADCLEGICEHVRGVTPHSGTHHSRCWIHTRCNLLVGFIIVIRQSPAVYYALFVAVRRLDMHVLTFFRCVHGSQVIIHRRCILLYDGSNMRVSVNLYANISTILWHNHNYMFNCTLRPHFKDVCLYAFNIYGMNIEHVTPIYAECIVRQKPHVCMSQGVLLQRIRLV